MSDQDLRGLLAALDEVQPAPTELVERVWRDVESLLTDGRDARRPDGAAASDVVLDLYVEAAAPPAGLRPPWSWLAVAAGLLLVALVFVAAERVRDEAEDVAVDQAPSSSLAPLESRPATLEAACAAFRTSTADLMSIDDERVLDDAGAIRAWLDALAVLAEDLDRLGPPESTGDHEPTVQLLLLRSALRNVELRLDDGDTERAATSLANAARHRASLRRADTAISDCFE